MTPPNKDGKKTADRGPSGRFAKGNRASPGRPAGRGKVAELRDKLAQDLDQIIAVLRAQAPAGDPPVSSTHLRAHETRGKLVCRLALEKTTDSAR